jgi:hypothetical protein
MNTSGAAHATFLWQMNPGWNTVGRGNRKENQGRLGVLRRENRFPAKTPKKIILVMDNLNTTSMYLVRYTKSSRRKRSRLFGSGKCHIFSAFIRLSPAQAETQ